jgi:hypothetical protein
MTRDKQIFGPVIAEYNPWFGKPSMSVHQRAHMAKQCNSSLQVPGFFWVLNRLALMPVKPLSHHNNIHQFVD